MTDAAPPAAEELEGKDFSGGIAALLEQGTTLLGEALRENLRGAVLILGVVLLCGAADAVLRTPESPMRRFLPMAGAAAIAVLSLGSMKSLLGLGTQTIEELDVFSKAHRRMGNASCLRPVIQPYHDCDTGPYLCSSMVILG